MAPGQASRAYRAELNALVALAAVYPAGVPAAVVREILPEPNAMTLVPGLLREWLGVGPNGTPRLGERNGAWHLSPDVRADLRTFQALLDADDQVDESRRLASALAMIRGELLAGVSLPPPARQAVDAHLADFRALVVRAVRRDMQLAMSADDPARADWALRQGLVLLPREEGLWAIRLGLHG